MNFIIEYFEKLTDTSDWPPRWHCGNWTDFHGWLYITGNLLIWSAYFAIPLIIIKYVSKRKDVYFHRIYFLFAAFILACGVTHFFDAVAFWFPAYRLNALLLVITGLISWLTVFSLIKVLPHAFELKSSRQLQQEIELRKKTEMELSIINAQLIEAQKIAKITNWDWDLQTNLVSFPEGSARLNRPVASDAILVHEYIKEKIHPDDQGNVTALLRKAIDEKNFSEHCYRLLLPDGEFRFMLARGKIVVNENNKVIRLFGTLQDVSDEKKAEQVVLSNSQKLEALNTELQQFAYLASHDLQEPLRKMTTFTSMLEKDCKEVISEKGKIYISKIISSSARMKTLINAILNFSKLNIEQVTYSTVSLNKVVAEVMSDMEVLIDMSGASVQVDDLPEVEGNPARLNQLFQNLISNGIKFSNKQDKPAIRITAENINGSALPQDFIKEIRTRFSSWNDPKFWEGRCFCKIYIQDNGIGFDEVYLEKLFLIFERLHNKTVYEGTGIGLAVCRKIVENHHGIITARSELGKGATFIVILPLSQAGYE